VDRSWAWGQLHPRRLWAAAGGDPVIWNAFARKLQIGFYATRPDLIAIVGHAGGRNGAGAGEMAKLEVARIVRRIRSLLLPSRVLGFWTDEQRRLLDCVEPEDGQSPDLVSTRRPSDDVSLPARRPLKVNRPLGSTGSPPVQH
jgi:hypothetical protein